MEILSRFTRHSRKVARYRFLHSIPIYRLVYQRQYWLRDYTAYTDPALEQLPGQHVRPTTVPTYEEIADSIYKSVLKESIPRTYDWTEQELAYMNIQARTEIPRRISYRQRKPIEVEGTRTGPVIGAEKIQVVNIRSLTKGWQTNSQYVYIGRKNHRYGVKESKWQNPYPLRKESEREKLLARFREHILSKPDLLSQLSELKGKTLVCWCKPKPCHGDVLVELVSAG